jgi:hypothetical protein
VPDRRLRLATGPSERPVWTRRIMTAAITEPVAWSPAPSTQRELARSRFPARPMAACWPATERGREQVHEQLTSRPFVLANTE